MAKPGFKMPKPHKAPKKRRQLEKWEEGTKKNQRLLKLLKAKSRKLKYKKWEEE